MIKSDQSAELSRRVSANARAATIDFDRLFELAAAVSHGESILDLGCGPGRILGKLARANGDAPALGLDVNPELIEHANQGFRRDGIKNASAATQDLGRAPFAVGGRPLEAESFDVVLSTAAIYNFGRQDEASTVTEQHKATLAAAVAEAARCLRPGGRLIANSPTRRNSLDLARVAGASGPLNEAALGQVRLPELATGEAVVPALLASFSHVRIAQVDNPVVFKDDQFDDLVGYLISCDYWTNEALMPAGVRRSEYLSRMLSAVAEDVREKGSFTMNKQFLVFECRKTAQQPGGDGFIARLKAQFGAHVREIGVDEARTC